MYTYGVVHRRIRYPLYATERALLSLYKHVARARKGYRFRLSSDKHNNVVIAFSSSNQLAQAEELIKSLEFMQLKPEKACIS
jgi:hypothetical protein